MNAPPTTNATVQFQPLPLNELGKLIVKHYGIHEGIWYVTVEIQVAVGRIGPSPDSALPGAMLGVSRIGLARAEKPGPGTIDASVVSSA